MGSSAASDKLKVLVIPDLFPKFEGDVQGIFILDYLRATAPHCTNTVLFGRLIGQQKGHHIETKADYTLHRFAMAEGKVPFYLKPFLYLGFYLQGYKIGKQFKDTDIIHAQGSILSGTLAYLISKKLKKPFIISEHQGPFSMTSENFWKKHWTKFIMQQANAVLTVSEHLKNEILESGILPKQIIVTHNPVDTELFSQKENTFFKTILFVGILDNFKGCLRSLQAFEKISTQFPEWKFNIIGDGEDYRAIVDFLKQHPELAKRVTLFGQLTKAEIAEQLKQADFLVFPSKHESFGLVITEALSTGLPVIVGDTTAPKEFVNKTNGILVKHDDVEAISKAMATIITQLDLYKPAEIRAEIVNRFGFMNFGKKLVDIYNSNLNKR